MSKHPLSTYVEHLLKNIAALILKILVSKKIIAVSRVNIAYTWGDAQGDTEAPPPPEVDDIIEQLELEMHFVQECFWAYTKTGNSKNALRPQFAPQRLVCFMPRVRGE